MTGLLITMPRFAASEIDPIMVIGIARRRGQGVAITRTARNLSGWPLMIHPARAMKIATGV